MSIIDAIKNSVLSQFTSSVTVPMIVTSLLTAFIISLFIILVYRKTFSGIVYNRNTCLTISMLAMITAMIIRTINSNLSLSLGMVGALSIVRFRTAIKEPIDTSFLFWALTAGIMSGAGLYLIAVIGSLALGLLYYLIYAFGVKPKTKYLLVVNYDIKVDEALMQVISKIEKHNLKSQSTNESLIMEKTFEVQFKGDPTTIIKQLQSIEGVKNVNLVTYQSDFGF